MKRESLTPEERQVLLDEVRSYLPAFLKRDATLQEDPAGDLRELLDLEQRDLDRVVAVHLCLDPAVLGFGEALEKGLARPLVSSSAVATAVSQSVRGQIDWQETLKHRARAPGELASYAVREPEKTFDTPENRAIAWLLKRLQRSVDEATAWRAKKPPGQLELSWSQQIDGLGRQLAAARLAPWLSAVRAEKPTPTVLRSLRVARSVFYREQVVAVAEAVLRLAEPSPETLTAVLAERYFRPEDDGTLFEVAVALRLARAFAVLSPHLRRARLMMGDGRSSFASYAFDDGSEVSLAYQAWPDDVPSMRRRFTERHRIGRPSTARPDIIIVRRGAVNDAVVLELKASRNESYLRKGLEELLAYLADRPDLWGTAPAGWLVAPLSPAFASEEADADFPLWILSAEEVAAAATARFVSG